MCFGSFFQNAGSQLCFRIFFFFFNIENQIQHECLLGLFFTGSKTLSDLKGKKLKFRSGVFANQQRDTCRLGRENSDRRPWRLTQLE